MRAAHRLRAANHLVFWVGGLYGCHGFTSVAYEVVWMSLMAASVGRTLAAMGTVLMVCTAGLGLGAAAMAWWTRHHTVSTRQLFVRVQLALGLGGAAFG
jgi:low temperature requirement protein LtrA